MKWQYLKKTRAIASFCPRLRPASKNRAPFRRPTFLRYIKGGAASGRTGGGGGGGGSSCGIKFSAVDPSNQFSMSRPSFSASRSLKNYRAGPSQGAACPRPCRRQFKVSRCCWSMDMDQLPYEPISEFISEGKAVTIAVPSSVTPAAEPAEPRLRRSGGMRRDWSFEDVQKANPIMVK